MYCDKCWQLQPNGLGYSHAAHMMPRVLRFSSSVFGAQCSVLSAQCLVKT
jgi:hypothetical protein